MKNVRVRYPHHTDKNDDTSDGVLIETMEDVKALAAEFERAENRVITKFVNSGEPSRRYDHVVNGLRPSEKPLAHLAIAYGAIHEKNPIYMLPVAKQKALASVTSALISSGGPVFMNPKGGFCPVMFANKKGEVEAFLEIVEEKEFETFDDIVKYKIPENTTYLNLENDWEMERASYEWISKKDENFSYITELSTLHLEYQLPGLIKKFVKNGGTHIYVYTTGQNYKQMYDYSKVAIQAGIKNFVFDFNSGWDDNINDFIAWLQPKANVEILND
jgi:hypothetical protein